MSPANEEEAGLSRRTLEIGFALAVLAMASAVIYDSVQQGSGWTDEGPATGYFPLRIGIVLFLGGLFVLRTAFKAPRTTTISWVQLKAVMGILLPLLLYVALIQPLGIYLPAAFLIVAMMALHGKFTWWQLVLAGVLVPLITFYVFELQFQVPLPKGPLERLLGF